MPISETGARLAEIKARSGLTWSQLADTIGASSGDYVRKVASGAKPGANLAGNVERLWETGSVERAVPRRRTAGGKIARVRTAGEERSRRPSETAIRGPYGARTMYRTAGGRLGWSTTAEAADQAAVRDALTSAGRGGKRVTVRARIRGADGRRRWVTIGAKGGYRPRDLRRQMDAAGGPQAWAYGLASGRSYGAAQDASDVEEVEILAE